MSRQAPTATEYLGPSATGLLILQQAFTIIGVLLAGYLLFAPALFLSPVLAAAVESTVIEKNGAATLSVDAPADKDGIVLSLADALTVTLQVDGSTTLEVKPAEKITKSPGWQLLAVSPVTTVESRTTAIAGGRSFTFEPLSPGALTLQIEPLAIAGRSGRRPQDYLEARWPFASSPASRRRT